MSINNDVFSVLVTKGDQALPAVGTELSALLPDQIGAFDANTNLAIDGSVPVREFFLAVGLDRDADGAIDDVNKSAGQLIQKRNISFLDYKPHTAGQPQIMELTGYKASCDSDYALKLEFRNQEIYRLQGTNQFTHTYAIKTACCDACETCGTGNCNEITKLMKEAINLDSTGLASAEAIATEALTNATHGTSVDYAIGKVIIDADLEILVAFNNDPANVDAQVCTGLRITSSPLKVNNYCSINLKYFKPRETVILASLTEGFNCNGSITTTQNVAFEQGLGYDIQRKEYVANGWKGEVYRTSGTTHTAINVEYFANKTIAYDQFALTYTQSSVAGWKKHLNNLATVIAIPATDKVTRNAMAALLNGLTPDGFDSLVDDVATSNVDPLVVESVDDLDDHETDGIA